MKYLRLFRRSTMCSVIINLLMVAVMMELTRLVFLWGNHSSFHLTWSSFRLISRGGLLFDISAILYVNCLWLALVFFPLHVKENAGFRKVEKIVFVVTNALALLANLCDTVFYAYRGHRSTMALFDEFGNEGAGNMAKIILTEAIGHWYLVVLLIGMVYVLWRFYQPAKEVSSTAPKWHYYLGHTLGLGFWVVIFIWGVRGCTLSKVTRPIAIGYAQRFATEPNDVDLVLNTPFAMIRTIGGVPMDSPKFFDSEEEMAAIYTPIHNPADSALLDGYNVVLLVLESFSSEFIGSLNPELENGTYKGYTPFFDSLISRSLKFEETYSNSGFSIDALPSILASTPRMRRSFTITPFSINHITGMGSVLGAEGYHTAFFHGADNESLGIQGFARQAGFENYYGLNEYLADKGEEGKKDYDGTWGIFDGPFLNYFCENINRMPQPFVAGVFTITNHNPFPIPKGLEDKYPEGKLKIHRTLRYVDDALRHFFEEASKTEWYNHTLFVLSADHASLYDPEHKEYESLYAQTKIPILLFDPSGRLAPGVREGMMQQIDILPTVLGLLGYDKPYFAFGNDVLSIPAEETWAFKWNHVPQLIQGDYALFMNTETWEPSGFYNIKSDPMMRHNILGSKPDIEARMTSKIKAIVQTYMEREAANDVRAD